MTDLAIDALDPLNLSDIPRFAGPAESAPYLHVPVSTVRAGVSRGDIPSVRLGRRIVIPLRAYVAQIERLTMNDESALRDEDASADSGDATSDSGEPEVVS